MKFEIELDDRDQLSYKGYWLNLNTLECYKEGMGNNHRTRSRLELFQWIDERELLLSSCKEYNPFDVEKGW